MLIKRLLIVLFALVIFMVQCEKKSGTQVLTDKGERVQKIVATFVLGKVMLKSAQTDSWESVKVGRVLGLNDTLRVGDNSRISLQSETGSVVVIKDLSEVVLNSVLNPKTGEENTDIAINSGKAIINPRKLQGNSKFAVRTPAMVAGVRGTVFTMEYRNNQSRVSVQEGKVAVKPTVDKEIEPKFKEVDVTPGQKAQISMKKVEELAKKAESEPQSETISQESIEVKGMDVQEQKTVEQEKKELVKLDINLTGEQITAKDEQKNNVALASVTISSLGNEIFINNAKVSTDYYSSLYSQGTELNVEIKKQSEVVLQQKITVPEKGIELNLTSADAMKKEMEDLSKKDLSTLFTKVGEGYPSADSLLKTADGIIFMGAGLIKIAGQDDKTVSIPYNMKIRPEIAGGIIFVSNRGNLEAYSSAGKKIGEAELGNIVFNTSICVYNNTAYLANSIGNITGLTSDGKKAFSYSLRDSLTAPVCASDKYVVTASPYKVYVLDAKNSNMIASFRPAGKVFKKIGIIGSSLIIPQDNNTILITDLNGRVLNKIGAIAENIEVVSDKLFMLKYSNKTVVYNLDGVKLKDVASGKSFMKNGKLVYAEGKSVVIDNFSSSKKVDFEENIKAVGDAGADVYVLTESGKLFKTSF